MRRYLNDGEVQDEFSTTDRVMTLWFIAEISPGADSVDEIGICSGKSTT